MDELSKKDCPDFNFTGLKTRDDFDDIFDSFRSVVSEEMRSKSESKRMSIVSENELYYEIQKTTVYEP